MQGLTPAPTTTRTLPFPPSPFSLTHLATSRTILYAQFPAMSNGSQNGSCRKTIPIFNNDGYYFTPSFILGYDRKGIERDWGCYRRQFYERVTDSQQEKLRILVPRPTLKNNYCCVCMASFQDYLTHNALASHQERLINNPYRQIISQLCIKFQQQSGVEQLRAKGQKQVMMESVSDGVKKNGIHVRKTKPISKLAVKRRVESCGQSIGTMEDMVLQ